MSIVSGNLVYKTSRNIRRPAGGFLPPSTLPDPFFDSVLLLLPFSDTGTVFTDYSGLANPVILEGAGAEYLEQDNSAPIFGLNSLRSIKLAGQDQKRITSQNLANVTGAADDLCIEYQFIQFSNSNATAAPTHAYFILLDGGGLPINLGWFVAVSGGPVGQLYLNVNGTDSVLVPFTYGVVHYVATQYVDADSRMYMWLDGIQVASLAANSNTGGLGFRGAVTSFTPVGPTATLWDCAIGNYRATRANRYGSAATIPIPTAPWPTFGP